MSKYKNNIRFVLTTTVVLLLFLGLSLTDAIRVEKVKSSPILVQQQQPSSSCRYSYDIVIQSEKGLSITYPHDSVIEKLPNTNRYQVHLTFTDQQRSNGLLILEAQDETGKTFSFPLDSFQCIESTLLKHKKIEHLESSAAQNSKLSTSTNGSLTTIIVEPSNSLRGSCENSLDYNNQTVCPTLKSALALYSSVNSNVDPNILHLRLLLVDGFYDNQEKSLGQWGLDIPDNLASLLIDAYSGSNSSVVFTGVMNTIFDTPSDSPYLGQFTIRNIQFKNITPPVPSPGYSRMFRAFRLYSPKSLNGILKVNIEQCVFDTIDTGSFSLVEASVGYGSSGSSLFVSVEGSTFTNIIGGAIYASGVEFALKNTSFISNAQDAVVSYSPAFTVRNSFFSKSGGMRVHQSNSTIENSLFLNSTHNSFFSNGNSVLAITNVINSTFIGNKGSYGGALAVQSNFIQTFPATFANIINSTFINNTAIDNLNPGRGEGGAIYFYTADGLIQNSRFEGNLCNDVGGTIMFYHCKLNITSSTIVNNRQTSDFKYKGALYPYSSSLLVTDTVIEVFDGTVGGGMLCSYSDVDMIDTQVKLPFVDQDNLCYWAKKKTNCTFGSHLTDVCTPKPLPCPLENCLFKSGNTTIDLSPLSKKDGYSVSFGSGSFSIEYNFCRNTPICQTNNPMNPPSQSCQLYPHNYTFEAGTLEHTVYGIDSKGIDLRYTSNENWFGCTRSNLLRLNCDPNIDYLVTRLENYNTANGTAVCNYKITISTKYACPLAIAPNYNTCIPDQDSSSQEQNNSTEAPSNIPDYQPTCAWNYTNADGVFTSYNLSSLMLTQGSYNASFEGGNDDYTIMFNVCGYVSWCAILHPTNSQSQSCQVYPHYSFETGSLDHATVNFTSNGLVLKYPSNQANFICIRETVLNFTCDPNVDFAINSTSYKSDQTNGYRCIYQINIISKASCPIIISDSSSSGNSTSSESSYQSSEASSGNSTSSESSHQSSEDSSSGNSTSSSSSSDNSINYFTIVVVPDNFIPRYECVVSSQYNNYTVCSNITNALSYFNKTVGNMRVSAYNLNLKLLLVDGYYFDYNGLSQVAIPNINSFTVDTYSGNRSVTFFGPIAGTLFALPSYSPIFSSMILRNIMFRDITSKDKLSSVSIIKLNTDNQHLDILVDSCTFYTIDSKDHGLFNIDSSNSLLSLNTRLTIRNSEFVNINGTSAILTGLDIVLDKNDFIQNSGFRINNSSVRVQECSFIQNAGALVIVNSNTTIKTCIWQACLATPVEIVGLGYTLINKTYFIDNNGTNSGAVYVNGAGATFIRISGSVFANNTAQHPWYPTITANAVNIVSAQGQIEKSTFNETGSPTGASTIAASYSILNVTSTMISNRNNSTFAPAITFTGSLLYVSKSSLQMFKSRLALDCKQSSVELIDTIVLHPATNSSDPCYWIARDQCIFGDSLREMCYNNQSSSESSYQSSEASSSGNSTSSESSYQSSEASSSSNSTSSESSSYQSSEASSSGNSTSSESSYQSSEASSNSENSSFYYTILVSQDLLDCAYTLLPDIHMICPNITHAISYYNRLDANASPYSLNLKLLMANGTYDLPQPYNIIVPNINSFTIDTYSGKSYDVIFSGAIYNSLFVLPNSTTLTSFVVRNIVFSDIYLAGPAGSILSYESENPRQPLKILFDNCYFFNFLQLGDEYILFKISSPRSTHKHRFLFRNGGIFNITSFSSTSWHAIIDSRIASFVATDVEFDNSYFSQSDKIVVQNSIIRIDGCNFTENNGALSLQTSTLEINNSVWYSNRATGIISFDGTVEIKNSSFVDNTGSSGAIDVERGTTFVFNCVFINNFATSLNRAGALSTAMATVRVENSTFDGNTGDKGTIYSNSTTISILDITVTNRNTFHSTYRSAISLIASQADMGYSTIQVFDGTLGAGLSCINSHFNPYMTTVKLPFTNSSNSCYWVYQNDCISDNLPLLCSSAVTPPPTCKPRNGNVCGGPDQGVCTVNGCVCISPWIGTDCSSKVIPIDPPHPNTTSPNTIPTITTEPTSTPVEKDIIMDGSADSNSSPSVKSLALSQFTITTLISCFFIISSLFL
ncbi:hypothetical protein CYY_001449 [Polysphondylium violaceum]|uniref:MRH domain-containing protein n=1 Tax=Polysphondylium violaceum TaxID=133409 RepID=A0A8J4Q1Z0_9MYCE|nr:hypothetical protein CYY_001449 [Polysphondylium violaceum]